MKAVKTVHISIWKDCSLSA